MEVKIESDSLGHTVYVNGNVIGHWVNLDGAIEAIRKEIEARYHNPYGS